MVIKFLDMRYHRGAETSSVGTQSASTQATAFNDDAEDYEDVFYDAEDASLLDRDYEPRA